MVQNFVDEKTGKICSQLFLRPGASMGTSAKDGWQVFGAGFIKAESDCHIELKFFRSQNGKRAGDLFYVWGSKIEWDKRGEAVAVHGLNPPAIGHATNHGLDFIELADTADPKVVDGKLYLRLAPKGDQQVVVSISNFSLPHPSGVGITGTIQALNISGQESERK